MSHVSVCWWLAGVVRVRTRCNSHYKMLLDALVTLVALRRSSRALWLLWFLTYWDFFDPFVY